MSPKVVAHARREFKMPLRGLLNFRRTGNHYCRRL